MSDNQKWSILQGNVIKLIFLTHTKKNSLLA